MYLKKLIFRVKTIAAGSSLEDFLNAAIVQESLRQCSLSGKCR